MVKPRLKGLLIYTILVGITIAPAFGQKKANFRIVEYGAGPSLVAIYDNSSQVTRYPKLSGAATAGLVYSIKRNLSVTAHVMYERKGGKARLVPQDIEAPEIEFNTTSSYLTFAPGVRRYLGSSGVFVEGGPFIAFLFASNTKRYSNGIETHLRNQFTTVDVGFSGSIGVTPMRRQLKGLNFRLVNNLGLVDVNHRTGVKEWTNSLSLIAGMRIRTR